MRRMLVIGAVVLLALFQSVIAFAADGDGDLISDDLDNCPGVANPYQGDLDGDGIGDRCDTDAVTAASVFSGTDGDDLVFGTDGADTLAGADGNDALYGEAGDDTIDGGNGRDLLSGGGGTDTLTGGPDCDVFAVDPAGPDPVTITDFVPGVDRFAFPRLDDEPGDDPVPMVATTTDGDGWLVVEFSDGAAVGFPGIEAGADIDLDTSPCDPPPFPCVLTEFSFGFGVFGVPLVIDVDGRVVFGTDADEVLHGTRCSDFLTGDEITMLRTTVLSSDHLFGFGGDDVLIGDGYLVDDGLTGGDDTLWGGSGNDLLIGDAWIVGSAGVTLQDCIDCNGFLITASGGDDTIHGGTGDDVVSGDAFTMAGPAVGGDDEIWGDAGNDVISGDAYEFVGGATTTFDLRGPVNGDPVGGADAIHGGDGNDILTGDAYEIGMDTGFGDLTPEDRTDVSGPAGGDDEIWGDAGDDLISGDASRLGGFAEGGDDILWGGDGSDEIGGDAGEEMSGYAVGGDDVIDGGDGADILYGDSGSDMVDFTRGGDDVIDGGAGDDWIYGDAGDDMWNQSTGGADRITGGAGNDRLWGDAGDTLDGTATAGADTFVYDLAGAFGHDTIHDAGVGSVEDTIEFTGVTDLAALDARSTVGVDGSDVVGTVYSDGTKTTALGSIRIVGVVGGAIGSWADVDTLPEVAIGFGTI